MDIDSAAIPELHKMKARIEIIAVSRICRSSAKCLLRIEEIVPQVLEYT